MKKRIIMILALDEKNGLGKGGDLPWRIKKDMKLFKEITSTSSSEIFPDFGENKVGDKKNAVIMGRKTWDSIPYTYKPLPNRINCILSRSYFPEEGYGDICKFNSIKSSIASMQAREDINDIFILGGAQIYNQVIEQNLANIVFLTQVSGDYNCDVFVDSFKESFELTHKSGYHIEGEHEFRFEMYNKKLTSNHK